jgi:hypothetical protein
VRACVCDFDKIKKKKTKIYNTERRALIPELFILFEKYKIKSKINPSNNQSAALLYKNENVSAQQTFHWGH